MELIDTLRKFRLGSFAVFDLTVSFLGMLALSPLLSWLCKKLGFYVPKRSWVVFTLPISVLAHMLVGRITPFTGDVLDPNGNYASKAVVLASILLGSIGIRRIKMAARPRG